MSAGVTCGIVVVEERNAKGSSVRKSRRTNTLVHAAGSSAGGGATTLVLVGQAGTETYPFRKSTCQVFSSFMDEGKLTVCTEGMRQQIMMREADPALLAELLSSLLGTGREDSRNISNNDENIGGRGRRITGKSTNSISTSRTTTQTGAAGAKKLTTALGPLQPRDYNSPVYRGLRATTPPRRMLNTGLAAAGKGVDGVRRVAGGAPVGTSRDARLKGRKMDTPTKESVGSRLPERKSTRRNSPQKNPHGGGSGVRGGACTREVVLSKDQQQAVDLVLEGKSVFFTGCAGTGKSLVLNRILTSLAEEGIAGVHATATTGLAACQLKGTTIQQFSGIGKSRGSGVEVLKVVRKRPDAVRRWRAAQVLVVDEISMLDADTFDALEYVARELRGNSAPFGGIRLVLSGDFFQLPPVSRRGEPEKKLCFEAVSWKACVQESIRLKLVYRQRDNKFVKLLSRVRWGQCTPEVLEELRRCQERCRAATETGSSRSREDGIEETQLLTHKADVLRVNEQRLGQLEGDEVLSRAEDKGSRPDHLKQLDDSCPAPATLRTKVGAQVILVKNLATGRGLANGSRGVVVRYIRSNGVRLPVVRFASGLEEVIRPEDFPLYVGGVVVACRRQLPIALAWALSIHKSQGMSLDRVSVCLSRAFEYGQAYVALSRVRSLEGLSIVGAIDASKIRAHPRVVEFYRGLAAASA